MTARHLIWHRCPAHPEYRWIDSYTQLSLRTQFKVATVYSIHTQCCLDVRQDWYPMYYPEGMKARVSPVQSIEPHRILPPNRDSNQKPLGPQSRVVTTILPLHTTEISWVLLLQCFITVYYYYSVLLIQCIIITVYYYYSVLLLQCIIITVYYYYSGIIITVYYWILVHGHNWTLQRMLTTGVWRPLYLTR